MRSISPRWSLVRSALFVAVCLVDVSHFITQATAQDRKFPYEAVVDLDGEYVRSGPGPNFYPTEKLKRADKVMVHRHDPGGWCMIAPPSGSFSWILAEHVQKSGDNAGVLKANNVVVHIGSSINPDEFTTIQGNLSKGDAVQILGEKTFVFEDRSKLMYKISPIKREWRWIPRKALVASDAIRSEPFPAEPLPRGKKPSGPVAEGLDPDAFAKPISTGPAPLGGKPRPGEQGTSSKVDSADGFRVRLDKIDRQFREMVMQEPPTWNLDNIAEQYRTLDKEVSQPAMSHVIAGRLDAVTRYQKIHADYSEFLKLTSETRQRDAQLASLQQQGESQLRALGANTTSTPPVSQPTLGAGQPLANQPIPNMVQAGQPATGTATGGTAGGAMAPNTTRPANPNSFAGAGLVQPMSKTFPGGPQYALIAPDGKLLAYLQPAAGVDLRRNAGQAMGIIGDRQFRQDWGADTITVRGLQPVQLKTGR